MGKSRKSKPKAKKSSGTWGKSIKYAAYRTMMDSTGKDPFKRAGVAMGFGKMGVGSYYLTKGFRDINHQAKGLPPTHTSIDPYTATGVALGMGMVQDSDDLLDLALDLDAIGAFDSSADFSAAKIHATPSKTVRKYIWRDYCEDGAAYGISPQNYETADEYAEALRIAKGCSTDIAVQDSPPVNTAPPLETISKPPSSGRLPTCGEKKYIWRKYCADGSKYGVAPEDYETAEEYAEALEKAMRQQQ